MSRIESMVELLRRLAGRPTPDDSEHCPECARLWEAGGYDPDVRCRRHRHR